jgi:glyoxylase-like metal-dependent hydrolase (beta-lactamase superfamily II)
MAYTTLEDFFGDIVGKARNGLGVSDRDIEDRTGLSAGDLRRIGAYDLVPDDQAIQALADVLELDGQKLAGIAHGWVPERGNDPVETDLSRVDRVILSAGMEVNAYVMKCKKSGKGALVDAGGQPDRIQALIDGAGADITHILLTHGHGDHVGALSEMKRRTGASVHCSSTDAAMLGSQQREVDIFVEEGWNGAVGELPVTAFGLPGHTAGGIGYFADTAFFSGDALFAGSLGGVRSGAQAYRGQIEAVWTKVLSLAESIYILPGHGPVTTVGQERAHNPYFVA